MNSSNSSNNIKKKKYRKLGKAKFLRYANPNKKAKGSCSTSISNRSEYNTTSQAKLEEKQFINNYWITIGLKRLSKQEKEDVLNNKDKIILSSKKKAILHNYKLITHSINKIIR